MPAIPWEPEEIRAISLALKHKGDLSQLGSLSEQVQDRQGLSVGAVFALSTLAKRLGITRAWGEHTADQAGAVTSSYLEGTENEQGAFGYNRDGKRGKQQIVIGLLCDSAGEPLSVEVLEGQTSDMSTFASQVRKVTNHPRPFASVDQCSIQHSEKIELGLVVDRVEVRHCNYIR